MAKQDLPPALRERIDRLLAEHETVLFMKGHKTMPQCGFSARVVSILNGLGVPYTTVNILADQELREGIKAYNDWPTIPQLVHKGVFLGGCDIVSDMAESGELAPALGLPGSAPVG